MSSKDRASSDGPDYELIVALVALTVSVFALVIALFQALQQCFASATGYASCQELVIGKWSEFTNRQFRVFELRFEVEYQTPVIFVSHPNNKSGPLGPHLMKESSESENRGISCYLASLFGSKLAIFQFQKHSQEVPCHEITYLVGTDASYRATHTWSQESFDQQVMNYNARGTRQAIRTADNELATWLALIMAVQRMERESRSWQANHYLGFNPNIPREASCNPDDFDKHNPNDLHTLTVGMQKKRGSWDIMPENMKKPYATSTICHMIEIVAMLGIHWKIFDRDEDRYRAQGNGFLVTGVNVDKLGIVFTFQKVGETWFEDNRVIPDESVKELCFGYCPTIFRPAQFKMYVDEPKDMGTLQLASLAAMAETVTVIGCNTKTVQYFLKPTEDTRFSHLFPLAFEILGMVGIVLQMKECAFRMLPNPCIHQWNRKSFSIRLLLSTYNSILAEAITDEQEESPGESQNTIPIFRDSERIRMITTEAGAIEAAFDLSIQRQNQGRSPDSFATCPGTSLKEHTLYSRDLICTLHKAIQKCDEFLGPRKISFVQPVLRVHLEEVLSLLNLKKTNGSTAYRSTDRIFEGSMNYQEELHHIRRLDSASYEEKNAALMNMYIFFVRKSVINKLCSEFDRERKHTSPYNKEKCIQRNRTLMLGPSLEIDEIEQKEREAINDIWCILVFRMICWLLLHDFHSMDIQVDKHELFGNRLPVYIS